MIVWLFIKTCLTNIIPFCLKHWRIILIGLICFYAYQQKTAHEASVQELATFKAKQAKLYDEQVAKTAILKQSSKILVDGLVATHKKQLADAKLDRAKVTDKLKGSINEISNSLTIATDAIRLRNGWSSSPLPKVQTDTTGLSETERNCYGHLATVIDACRVTDYDYKALYNLYDGQCKLLGCE
jgi:polyhydroxyalkanoate synthesis regulator phasin